MKNDQYFLKICEAVGSHSKCLSRKIGAIIVRDGSIISTGYNGPPRGVPHCDTRFLNDKVLIEETNKVVSEWTVLTCPRKVLGFKSGEGLEYCLAGHSERNCIVNAAREGIKIKGAIMYMNCLVSCTPCLIEIINAGISEIVVTEMTSYDKMAGYLIENSGLKVRVFEK